MIIELTGHGERYGHNERDLEKIFETLGFVACTYDPFTRALEPEAPETRSKNKLYIRSLTEVRQRVKAGATFKVCGLEI